MAFSSIASACVQGLHIEVIHAESDVSNGLPMFHMVGYLSSEVKEAAERVRTAIRNSGFSLPPKKIVVNLSPATVKKKGASYDLPIALSVLEAVGNIPAKALERVPLSKWQVLPYHANDLEQMSYLHYDSFVSCHKSHRMCTR